MNQNFEKIKVTLLGVIALTLMVQTYYLFKTNEGHKHSDASPAPVSNMVAETPATNFVPPMDPNQPVAEPVPSGPPTSIKFAETEHNFGKIAQETDNKKVFKFTNTGKEPLIIQNAVGSCGCTVPTYPKEPIAPGKSGEIVVVYKPGQQKGSQTKTVTITANTEPLTTILYVKAEVEEAK